VNWGNSIVHLKYSKRYHPLSNLRARRLRIESLLRLEYLALARLLQSIQTTLLLPAIVHPDVKSRRHCMATDFLLGLELGIGFNHPLGI
jgi:hypothetical protein